MLYVMIQIVIGNVQSQIVRNQFASLFVIIHLVNLIKNLVASAKMRKKDILNNSFLKRQKLILHVVIVKIEFIINIL